MAKKKLLVTGASGFLGWHVCQTAESNWEVYGTCRTSQPDDPNLRLLSLDLTDFQQLQTLFQTLQPDAVVHTAAQARPHICQRNPQETYAINVTAAWNLAGLCADRTIPCAFTSTDFVFDGLHPPYTETDPVSPINYYGEQKVAAEVGMLDRYPATAICRMPLMFGPATPAPSFIQGFLKTLRSGQPLNLFTDEIRTPVSGRDAAQGLLMAIAQVQGILHLGGRERLSRYDFGRLMVEALEIKGAQLQPCHQADVALEVPRPLDVSMDSSKAFSLGYTPGSVLDELRSMRNQL